MNEIVLTVAELLELVIALTRNRIPDLDMSPFKDNYKRAAVLAGAVADTHATIRSGNAAFSPFTAALNELTIWGDLKNVTRRTATAASAEGAGLVLGAAGGGGSWTTSDLLVNPTTSIQYAPTAGGSVGAAPATASLGLIAQSTGTQGILAPGDVLQWVSTPTGLEDEVEVQLAVGDGVTTGLDLEAVDSFRNRVVAAWQSNKRGGSPADYLQWLLDSNAEFATGYVWKGRNGRGTVDLAALKAGDGSARLPSAGERTALESYIEARNPHPEQFRVLEVLGEATPDIEVALEPEPGEAFARDWNDSAGFTVSAYTPATRTLQLSAARPASLAVGSRLVVTATPGRPLVVESLSSTDSVIVVEDFGYTISASENVYAGGGLTLPTWQAIVDFVNALGPRRGTFAQTFRSQDWFSTLDLSRLFGVVQNVDGVLDHDQNSPASSPSPTEKAFPDDAQVNVFVPGNITVRYR